MRDGSERIESLLLDLHLSRLDAGQALEVEEAIASSPELASQSRALRDVLALLDRHEVADAPVDLVDSVMARIDAEPRVIPFPQKPAAAAAFRSGQEIAATPVLSLRELVAIAACITLFIGVFVPGYFKAQNIARRNLCRSNLQQVFAGLTAYSQDHAGYLPYTHYVANASWLPTRAPNVRRVSPTRPLYLLLRTGYVRDPRVFICPSAPHTRAMRAEDFGDFDDFAEPANITYSFQYMNRPTGRRAEAMEKEMVLLADRNPFFDGRAAHQIGLYDDRAANSLTHEDGAGQNVVYVGGSGGWYTRPTIGVDADNIYQAGHLLRYQGTEQPTCETDTFLVN